MKKVQKDMSFIHYYDKVTAPKKDADGKDVDDGDAGVSEMY